MNPTVCEAAYGEIETRTPPHLLVRADSRHRFPKPVVSVRLRARRLVLSADLNRRLQCHLMSLGLGTTVYGHVRSDSGWWRYGSNRHGAGEDSNTSATWFDSTCSRHGGVQKAALVVRIDE